MQIARELADDISRHPDFELLAPVPLSLVCFRYKPAGMEEDTALDQLNEAILGALNDSGKLYVTHTKLNGIYTLRLAVGQTYTQRKHVRIAWQLIRETAAKAYDSFTADKSR
jgi:aromatic-L-amino-acid decarboxylase